MARAAPIDSRAPSSAGSGTPATAAPANPSAYSDANTLPITATPSVAPSSRVVSLTAEPIPAFAVLTAPMIDSVAGAVVRPMPVPSRTICPAISRYGVPTDTVDVHA